MKIKDLTINAMLIALTAIVTLAIRVPTPTGGHINLGDTVIILAAFLFGAVRGALAGGIGSALADLIGGHYFFIPGTLIIKSLEGWIVGTLNSTLKNKLTARIISGLAGALIMVLGYFIYELIFINIAVAISVVIPNTLQGIVCVILAVSLYPLIGKKAK